MHNYLELLQKILDEGEFRGQERTGTGTYAIFGTNLKFDLSQGFPLLTTKRVHFKSVAHELIWFLSGSTNVKYLKDNGVRIWNEWANADGDLGRVYGAQWRNWRKESGMGVDQVSEVIRGIKGNPQGRRHIVTAWNPGELEQMALPPCHMFYHFFVTNDGRLDCQMYQRSVDSFLGLPFNIASYALLTHMFSHACDLKPGTLHWVGGDTHIYANHIDQVKTQLSREPRPLPSLKITGPKDIFTIKYEDIKLEDYNPCDVIKAKVSV